MGVAVADVRAQGDGDGYRLACAVSRQPSECP
jgi:hypothetical protein